MKKRQTVSVIIPTLNEIESIQHVLEEVSQVKEVDEILVVDGHSTDGTVELVKNLGHKIIPQEGKGYGRGVATGVKQAIGDVIILIDADGSYTASDIPKLLAPLEQGYDLVYGSRYLPESGSADDTIIRYIGNKFFTFLLNAVHGVGISDSLFLYIAAKRRVFETIEMKSANFEYCIEFPIRAHNAGFKHTEVPSYEKKRIAGESKVNAAYHGLRILWTLLSTR
jgi:glycosyltransferase involved in cell wall biosynthesis